MDNRDLKSLISSQSLRLSVAFHRITNILDSDEPLRFSIREKSVHVLETSMSLVQSSRGEDFKYLADLKDTIGQSSVLLEVLLNIGSLSETNFQVIKDELLSLVNNIDLIAKESDPFNVTTKTSFTLLQRRDGVSVANAHEEQPYVSRTRALARGLATERNTDIGGTRKERIVGFVKQNGPSSVRDLSRVIQGCSDKTIQRELVDLVNAGLLQRMGERRWSRYLMPR